MQTPRQKLMRSKKSKLKPKRALIQKRQPTQRRTSASTSSKTGAVTASTKSAAPKKMVPKKRSRPPKPEYMFVNNLFDWILVKYHRNEIKQLFELIYDEFGFEEVMDVFKPDLE